MAKSKTSFFCNNCGYESTKWLGKCTQCNEWNSFVEETVTVKPSPINRNTEWKNFYDDTTIENNISVKTKKTKAANLATVTNTETQSIQTLDDELNRVLGGGIVGGSLVLVGGEPGIGKSTLFLQNALHLQHIKTLYVSGEESAQQIKLRANRLQIENDNFYLLTETDTQQIFKEVRQLKPDLIIIDSIQTMFSPFVESSPGSILQIRETAAEFQRFAKETNVPVFMIGHITKEGQIAGPKILEHMVDTVLQFEGDRHYTYRILRTLKNRFGSTAEMGIYDMSGAGMRPVTNPSEILITQKDEQLSGIGIAATLEGLRPLLLETQALVTPSVYGTPQRTVSGFDVRRLQLLLAVLDKKGGFQFGNKDVFINIAGGIKIDDPAMDLSIVSALLSSYEDVPISSGICFAGEVGLSGEIRAVNKIDARIAEAAKLGFEKIIISKYNTKNLPERQPIQLIPLAKVSELYQYLF